MLRLALTTCYENREVRHTLCAYDVIKKKMETVDEVTLEATGYSILHMLSYYVLGCVWKSEVITFYFISFNYYQRPTETFETINGIFYISCNVVSRDDSLRKEFLFFVKSLIFPNTAERVSSLIGKPFPSILQLKLFLEAFWTKLCARISRLLFWIPMALIKMGLHHGYKFWVQHDVCVFSVQKV